MNSEEVQAMHDLVPVAQGFAPARGFPPGQVIPATVVAVLLTAAVALAVVRYRQGRFAALERVAARAEQATGLPAWASLPIGMTTLSLLIAVFGFYWDVAWHIDKGRDDGPFSTPAHYPIIIGLVGIAIAGVTSLALDTDDHPHGIRLPGARGRRIGRVSVGGALLTLCGLVALAGFPLDDVWHTLFGQDVTLWGPTHIQMIGGASLATVAAWILREEGRRRAPALHRNALDRPGFAGRAARIADYAVGGSVLIGLSTLQGEFDFGVPQFRAVYHPILIMLAASIALVAARVRSGRGGALMAVVVFVAVRGGLTLLIGPVLGRTTLHFPLYLAEAAIVELVALAIPVARQVTFGLVSGLLIGTAGLAAEWGWTQVWMPLPWRSSMWPLAPVLGLFAALAGGALGGMMGRALLPPGAPRQATPRLVMPMAWAAALATIAIAMPMSAHHDYTATVTLTDVDSGPQRSVMATVKLDPPQAADHATWFTLTSWQGGDGVFRSHIVGQWVVPLRKVGDGTYRSTRPVPVYGQWKTLLRLATVDSLQAVPVYLPADPAIPAAGVPATARFTRPFVADKKILQREAVGGSVALQRLAYALLALLGLVWVAGIALGMRRLDRAASGTAGDPPAAGARSGADREVSAPGRRRGRTRTAGAEA
jgi:hypothetical protein